jgi:hypothetical protein
MILKSQAVAQATDKLSCTWMFNKNMFSRPEYILQVKKLLYYCVRVCLRVVLLRRKESRLVATLATRSPLYYYPITQRCLKRAEVWHNFKMTKNIHFQKFH